MHMIINNLNTENIISFEKKNKIILKYKIDDFYIIGLPLLIKYSSIIYNNFLSHIYIESENDLKKLLDIEKEINKKYQVNNDIQLVKYNNVNNKNYITCKRNNIKNEHKNTINKLIYINILKIQNNIFYNYII